MGGAVYLGNALALPLRCSSRRGGHVDLELESTFFSAPRARVLLSPSLLGCLSPLAPCRT